MRPIRLVLLLALILTTIILLLLLPKSSRPRASSASAKSSSSRFHSLFTFHSPLFPLSAIISLTDDNSTFFLSRPAAFGPLLPEDSLSSQLWIGKGFGEDPLGRVGVDATPEGELGCSDVQGWDGVLTRTLTLEDSGSLKTSKDNSGGPQKEYNGLSEDKSTTPDDDDDAEVKPKKNSVEDGTDDYLHEPIVDAAGSVTGNGVSTSDEHADIQSLQEMAEIGGKVVLLSRGGCGFLEKVKWAQKRGAVAVIVGDNIPGGPLLTMYAKGDTSNVTIPALFTSYTTAHLLSSLIPSGGRLGATLPSSGQPNTGNTLIPSDNPNDSEKDYISVDTLGKPDKAASGTEEIGWFKSIMSGLGLAGGKSESNTRPPSSGHNDWVIAQDWDEDQPKSSKKKGSPDKSVQNTDAPDSLDNFVIGVHDWRNPDLLKKPSQSKQSKKDDRNAKRSKPKGRELRGGPATPESGQYAESENLKDTKSTLESPSKEKQYSDSHSGDGWLSILKGHGKPKKNSNDNQKSTSSSSNTNPSSPQKEYKAAEVPRHEGLWVTLTPTTMSSSPFIDTLLVLVVSPLVTLTLVYALLLIRSRIRRRRWRAPKSVVDRLPIRTYHTIQSGASTSSLSTPATNTSNPNTPLLQSTIISRSASGLSARSHSRHRPRSFTTSEVLDQVGPSGGQHPPSDHGDTASMTESEKREKGLAEWRRRYGGRQRECVVCLEEYVDGVSQVMGLPCGHEFHAECITPWLTTRRRTCPICKGDVVRSLARADRTDRPGALDLRTGGSQGSTDSDSDVDQSDQPLLDNVEEIEDDDDDPELNGVGHNWHARAWSRSGRDYLSSWWNRLTGRNGQGRDDNPDRNR